MEIKEIKRDCFPRRIKSNYFWTKILSEICNYYYAISTITITHPNLNVLFWTTQIIEITIWEAKNLQFQQLFFFQILMIKTSWVLVAPYTAPSWPSGLILHWQSHVCGSGNYIYHRNLLYKSVNLAHKKRERENKNIGKKNPWNVK